MDFQTAVNKMKEGAAAGKALCAVRPIWLQEAADFASFCCCTMFESEYICLASRTAQKLEDLAEDSEVFYTNDIIDNDETREATDFMLFDEPPSASFSADGKEVCVSIDPVEQDQEVQHESS